VTEAIVAPNIGGLVLSKAKLDSLTPANRAIVVDTGKLICAALTTRIRAEDEKAFARLKEKMTVVTATPAQTEQWQSLYREARVRLGKGSLPPALIAEVEKLAK
jgi:TRAP-type transport system periplasmic protein